MAYDYKILKDYGTIADHNGIQLKLQLISWNGNPAKLDLRVWKNGYATGGLTMTKDELKKLGEMIDAQMDVMTKPTMIKKPEVVKTESKKRGRPPKKVETNIKIKTEKKAKKETNVIQFPKQKVDIEKAITEGNSTYEQCEEKINAELKKYVDADSQYVLNGVLELCKVDQDFRNNVMREDRHFGGALEYMMKMCRDGYGYKMGNCGFMDRDMGLGFTIDYFNLKSETAIVKEA